MQTRRMQMAEAVPADDGRIDPMAVNKVCFNPDQLFGWQPC